jgi:multidrug efflux pump subunit AcrA (membrane-fusion protein)
VYTIRGGRALPRTVLAGISDGENSEILQGLTPGDTVATIGLNNLRDSSFVSLVERSK